MPFRFPPLDSPSFWIGVAIATAAWWVLSALRRLLQHANQGLKAKSKERKEKVRPASAIEERYRHRVLQQAQGLHLAAPLFSLDEILVVPRLLLPPVCPRPGAPPPTEDIVSLTLPFIPDGTALAAIYNAPTITIQQALAGRANLVLTGHPGCGKTTALAYLASLIARRDATSGLPKETIPVMLHVADLSLPLRNPDAVLDPVIKTIYKYVAARDLPRLPEFIKSVLREGRIFFLLDGLDELPPEEFRAAVAYLEQLMQEFPATRFITTANPDYLDGLLRLGFVNFVVAPWGVRQRSEFLDKWSDLWTRNVAVEAWVQSRAEQVDSLLLHGWLDTENGNQTPLELTLQTWAAFAGDVRGPSLLDAIAAHIFRLVPTDIHPEALELLALQVNLATKPVFEAQQAREWVVSFEPPEAVDASDEKGEPAKSKKSRKLEKASPKPGVLTKMVASGILCQHSNNSLRFNHPVFAGYLAGKALVNSSAEAVLNQPEWSGKQLALRYLSAHCDVTSLAEAIIAASKPPFHSELLAVAGWLREAPRTMPWRGTVIAKLTALLQDDRHPLVLRGKALEAFIACEDPSVAALFRQLHTTLSQEIAQLSALGSGALQDAKAIESLADLLNSTKPNVQRAASLALIAIGTTSAINALGSALLYGSENLRRIAAEALANHPQSGHAILKEGAAVDDLLVRRAVVYGLDRVDAPWVDKLLDKMQIEDKEWIVRTSATEVIESRRRPQTIFQAELPPASETPWLIAFAAKKGMGVSPNLPANDLLLMALKSGSEEERFAALSFLRQYPTEAVITELYQLLYGDDPLLKDAIFQVIWEMATSGVMLPAPKQFELGRGWGTASIEQ
jgi:HEAT repeat protein